LDLVARQHLAEDGAHLARDAFQSLRHAYSSQCLKSGPISSSPNDCSSFSSFDTWTWPRMKRSTSSIADSANLRSLPTSEMPSTARCQRSSSDTCATETLNLLRTRSLILRSTMRLSLSEWLSPRNSVTRAIATVTVV